MNKDLIIGIVVSLALHSSIWVFSHKNAPPKKAVAVKEEVMQFEMPPIEEEKIEEVEQLQDEPIETVMAPPSLVDVPSVVPVDAFVQPLTPPPPPGLTSSKNAVTIPVVKPGANFGRGISNLFNIGDLDQQPVARVRQAPSYPYDMRRAGINGSVVVEFIISTEGDVIQTQVVKSSHREFEMPALQAVQKWKFKPGRRRGQVVNVRASQLLEFNATE
ncbi:MAG TPA: energy transducer TonB [Lacunisphaera sp.]|nr:energy transducer TonB [Lacunisphaera sp.]